MPTVRVAAATRWLERRFWFVVPALAVLAFAVRAHYGSAAHVPRGIGDDLYYHWVALRVADGRGFTVPLLPGIFGPGNVPTAWHPPAFPALLALGSLLGLRSYHAHLLIGCALGSLTVVLITMLGRRLAGPLLGLAAGAVAAVYLPLVINDSLLMSESLYGLTIAAVVLAAYWFVAAPGPRRGAVLGAAIGVAALTRSEALLLFLLLVPFLLRRAGVPRLRTAGAIVAATLVLVVPWCVRNTIVFHRATTIATGDGAVIAQANTHATYYGALLGAWDVKGLRRPLPPGHDRFNEAAGAALLRGDGIRYAEHHLIRLPVVAGARVLRTWGLYPFDPSRQRRFNLFAGNHVPSYEWLTMVMGWLALLLAIPGALWLRSRGTPLAPLLAPIALVVVVSALFNGDVRYRQAANPGLVVLATLGAAALLAQVDQRVHERLGERRKRLHRVAQHL